jgi:4-amino-4-deoxy-L-arabinose transferase-like glycosyltransferase
VADPQVASSAGLTRSTAWSVALWWAAVTLAMLAWRPLTPVDETRYVTVAWEMWQRGDLVSLQLNGQPYGHKPPLLFWLINAGWGVFGVNAWWPRLLTALCALLALGSVARLMRRLVPGRPDVAAVAVIICATSLYWVVFTGAVMFDMLLTVWVLLAVEALVWAAAGGGWRAWVGVGLATGLGILTKGPVALLHVFPLALLWPLWRRGVPGSDGRALRAAAWYGGVFGALGVAAAVSLAWAVPAALAGGSAFQREIFWSQSVDRIATTTHHLRPFWFYAAGLPLLLAPWLIVPAVWRGALAALRRPVATDAPPGLRVLLAWGLPVVLAFSAFRGKQLQYLMPVMPAIAGLMAWALCNAAGRLRAFDAWLMAAAYAGLACALLWLQAQPRAAIWFTADEWPWVLFSVVGLLVAAVLAVLARPPAGRGPVSAVRGALLLGSAAVVAMLALLGGVWHAMSPKYDLQPMAQHVAAAQQAGRAVAHVGKYHGEYQFLGRLREPLKVLHGRAAVLAWAGQQPDGSVVLISTAPLSGGAAAAGGRRPEFEQRYRSRWVSAWRASDLAALPAEAWPEGVVDDDDDEAVQAPG